MGNTINALTEQCTCLKSSPEQELFNEFFKGMVIRSKPCQDWFELIKSKKVQQSKDKMADKKWLIIIEAVLINDNNYKEESLNYWRNILQYVREKYNQENYLYLSIFFLCENNKEEFIKCFNAFLEKYFNQECYNKENKTINCDILKMILVTYVIMISKGCVNEIKKKSSNKIEFEKTYLELFNENNIDEYVNAVVNGEDEWINVEEFFNRKYDEIVNDEEIRKILVDKSMNKINKETSGGKNNENEEDFEEKIVI